MKFNKWTLGLAAVGAVSLASAVRADEAKIIPLQTALSNTTISGYVDTAVQYNAGNVSSQSTAPAGTLQSQIDRFTLNNLDIALDHPLDSTPWAAGYHAEVNLGTEAVGYGTSQTGNANLLVRQAYLALSTPLGNGIQWKMGVQDDIIGYEGNTDGANPNYSRSVGYFIEPTTLLGLVGTYQITSLISVSGGVVDPTASIYSPYGNGTYPTGGTPSQNSTLSALGYAGSVSLTAPDSWGFLKGGTASAGIVANPEKYGQINYYAGFTIPTPLSKLKLGGAFDLISVNNAGSANGFTGTLPNPHNDSGWVLGSYANFQATDKLAYNLRFEVFDLQGAVNPYRAGAGADGIDGANGVGEELTATVQYNLWANVISRAEFRWDHSDLGKPFGGAPASNTSTTIGNTVGNSYILALNLIYTF